MKTRWMYSLAVVFSMLLPAICQSNDSASEDALTLEMREMAKEFAAIIEKKNGGRVAVGEFSASSDVRGSVGPQIQLVLAKELQALKLTVDNEDFRFEIKGDYQPYKDSKDLFDTADPTKRIHKASDLMGVRVIGRLIERDSAEVLVFKATGRFVFGAQTVPAMLGENVGLSPNADPREMSQAFEEAQKNPRAELQGTTVRSKAGSQYALQVLVKSGAAYQPRPIKADAKGRPLVPIDKSEIYGVRLINNSAHEAAVDLQIDGINAFEFSEIKARYWIVPAGKHVDILGWHKNNQKSLEFKVVEFPDTAAAKLNLKPSTSIGLITACFSASWDKDANRPADEPVLNGRGTGFGKEIDIKTEQVTRTIGQVRDTISVRYER